VGGEFEIFIAAAKDRP